MKKNSKEMRGEDKEGKKGSNKYKEVVEKGQRGGRKMKGEEEETSRRRKEGDEVIWSIV